MNKYKKKTKKSILIFKCVFIFFIFITILINILVDPYDVFLVSGGHKRGYHIGHMPGGGGHSHIIKAAGIIKYKPETIFLGSSVTDTGFRLKGNFAHLQMTKEITPIEKLSYENGFGLIYNASVRGGGIPTANRYLEHAYINNKNIKHVFIGIELPLLLHHADGTFNNNFISDNKMIGKTYKPLETIFKYSLTKDVTKVSLKTSKLFKFELPEIDANKISTEFKKAFQENNSTLYTAPKVIIYEKSAPIEFIDELTTRELFLSNKYTANFVKLYRNDKERFNLVLSELRKMVQFLKNKNIPFTLFICPMSPYNHALLHHTNNYDIIYDIYSKLAEVTPFYNFSKVTIFSKNYNNSFFSGDSVHFSSHVGETLSKYLLGKLNKKKYLVTENNFFKVVSELENDTQKFIKNSKENNIYFSKLDKNILKDHFNLGHSLIYQHYGEHFKKVVKKFDIVKLYGSFYALPKREGKYDLNELLLNQNENVLKSKSLYTLINKIKK